MCHGRLIPGGEPLPQASQLWRDRVAECQQWGKEEDADAIKAWLRSQHARKIRERKRDSKPEDFDLIGTEFHRWIRDHEELLGLAKSADFASFIRRDFKFYTGQYLRSRFFGWSLTAGLEPIYFNAQHNFTLQYPVLLAPLVPEDSEEEILRKLRVVSAFIDILITRRIWNWRNIDYSTLQYAMFTVIRDIRNKTAMEAAEVLSRRLADDRETFAKNERFALHGMNGRVIHRLLARMGDEVKHRPFHAYSMKQAIQEGFILDVLRNFTPVDSYYRLAKTIEGDPEFDVKKARKKLRRYVESHHKAIRDKAEIMVDHFIEQVIGQKKIGGEARAMVVTGSVQRAIQYFFALREYLAEIKSPYQAIVAFSGEPEYKGEKVTESSLNGFPSGEIAERIQADPYRFLICAEKFQTGYDEPLLHTMYVDKALSGIKAVQTLSRLNRAHPKKHDVFILDFQNDTETIQKAFADYYRTTVLSKETDPNKLHTLKAELDGYQVYSAAQIDTLVTLYLGGADRDKLDPILDACVAVYVADLDEDGQVDFKGSAKAFTRTYDFLATILPYGVLEWEKLSIFLNFLIPKLPAPKEEDLAVGILEAIDMDSYRAEKKATVEIALPDADAEIEPVPTSGGSRKPEPEMDKLSNIIRAFNEQFGGLFSDPGRMEQRITDEIPARVSADQAYQNAKAHSDRQNAKIEHDKALQRVITALFADDAQLFKQFQDNALFRQWLRDTVFGLTYG